MIALNDLYMKLPEFKEQVGKFVLQMTAVKNMECR